LDSFTQEMPNRPIARNFVVSSLCFLIAAAGAYEGYFQYLTVKTLAAEKSATVAQLERLSNEHLENHLWQNAIQTLTELKKISANSDFITQARRDIEAGMLREQEEFIAYWTAQASAQLSAGKLDAAVDDAQQVLRIYPTHAEAVKIQADVQAIRDDQARVAEIQATRLLLRQKNWSSALDSSQALITRFPQDSEAKSLRDSAQAGFATYTADLAKAEELYQMARSRDHGTYDREALVWLREARSLAPENAEIRALFEKFALYIRTLHVPAEFATPSEAIAQARDRDRVVIAAGTWHGPVVIDSAIDLSGAGMGLTKFQCYPDDGCVLTLSPSANGAHIRGISVGHQKIGEGDERFSAALVRGAMAFFEDCEFTQASGHGLAVMEGAKVRAMRCRFSENGWNGAAAFGKDTQLEIKDSQSNKNYDHGIEAWQEASIVLSNNRCEGNTGNGIHIDNGQAPANLQNNQLTANREFGLVIDSAGSGKISGNHARRNQLGGFVIRLQAASLEVLDNQATLNEGPGLILEKGLKFDAYSKNTCTENHGGQYLSDANLSAPPPVLEETR
jgi:hypothetical protein